MPIEPVVFAYNFPHKKTQDFLQRLLLAGNRPSLVLLANPVPLPQRPLGVRCKPRHSDLVEPSAICERFGLPWEVVDHRGARCVELLRAARPAVGVVAGARILPRSVLDCFSLGVVNFHPGLIPEVRGLNALPWAIHDDLPIGVTAHLIDHRVDAGRIVERRVIDEFADDTLIDLSLRLAETQVQMLPDTLNALESCDLSTLERVSPGGHRPPFTAELAAALPEKLAARQRRTRRAA